MDENIAPKRMATKTGSVIIPYSKANIPTTICISPPGTWAMGMRGQRSLGCFDTTAPTQTPRYGPETPIINNNTTRKDQNLQ